MNESASAQRDKLTNALNAEMIKAFQLSDQLEASKKRISELSGILAGAQLGENIAAEADQPEPDPSE